jgi:transposase
MEVMPRKLTRTPKFTLKFSNPGKLKELEKFAEEYLALVNFFWLYRLTLFKLHLKAEQENVSLVRVNPAYTSQRCLVCEFAEKENRKA